MTLHELADLGRLVRDERVNPVLRGDQRALYLLREQLRAAVAGADDAVLEQLVGYAPAGEAPAFAELELKTRAEAVAAARSPLTKGARCEAV